LNGRASRASIASSTLSRPSRTASTALAIGMSTPASVAIATNTVAVNAPSTRPPLAASAGDTPPPIATPNEKLRDWRVEHVKMRSPRPDSPVSVSGRAPNALPNRVNSAKPRVVSAAAALAPSLRPAAIPAAIASTFFAAPPISTPRTSVE
jgi:hypothetical protein